MAQSKIRQESLAVSRLDDKLTILFNLNGQLVQRLSGGIGDRLLIRCGNPSH